ARFAGAVADPAFAVAHHHDRREAEAPAALHHLGDAIDADELLDKFAVLAVAAAIAVSRAAIAATASAARAVAAAFAARSRATGFRGCHVSSFLEGEAALAGGVGQGLHPAMEDVAAAVEHHGLDARGDRALGDQLANRLRRFLVGTGLQ